MKRFFAILFPILFCAVQSLIAQTPVVIWQKCLGGNNGDYAKSIEPTADGGYIVAGYTEGPDNGDVVGYHGNPMVGDIWITKIDNTGNLQWQKCLGGDFFETGAYIHQLTDGNYIVAGTASSKNCDITGNHGGADFWVLKLNPKGDVIWQKLYGGSLHEYAYSLSVATDGGYIVAGFSASNDGDVTGNHGDRDFWVIKIDDTGNLLWQKSLGGSGAEEANSVQATADGGAIVAGFTESNNGDVNGNHGKKDEWIVKLDNTGSLQWQKAFGGSEYDWATSIQLTNDGGYIVAGSAGSNDGDVSGNHIGLTIGTMDFWVTKISATGLLEWEKCYGGNQHDYANFVQTTKDGGYVVTGSAESGDGDVNCHAGISSDAWTIKINNSGILEWQKVLGGSNHDDFFCIRELADGNYILAGITCSPDVSGYHAQTGLGSCSDFWIVKLSAPVSTIPNPVLTIDPASVNLCIGVTATISTSLQYGGTNPVYQWTRNGIPVGGNRPFFTASDFNNNDQLACRVTSGGLPCETATLQGTDAVTIHVNENMIDAQVIITADKNFICGCTPITFRSTVVSMGSAPVYHWKINGTETGTNSNIFITSMLNAGDIVTLEYSDNRSCIAKGTIVSNSIKINPGTSNSPSVQIKTTDGSLCSGSTVTFTAEAVNAGSNPVYQWKVNGSPIGANSDIFSISSLQSADAVSCSITVDPQFSCAGENEATSNTIIIQSGTQLPATVNITSSANEVCAGDTLIFQAVIQNAGNSPAYQWVLNGGTLSDHTPEFRSSNLSDGDILYCQLMPGNNACSTSPVISNTLVVAMKDRPTLMILPADTTINIGNQVQLTVLVTGNIASYNWEPSNKLENPFTLNPLTIPLSDNTAFSLSVISEDGCEASSKVNIRVGRLLAMPNAFSPDGNGKNEVFRIPPGTFLQLEEFSIFDRWGNKIFSTRNISEGWNGTVNGNPLDAGAYVYYIRGTNEKGKVFIKGTVLLVR